VRRQPRLTALTILGLGLATLSCGPDPAAGKIAIRYMAWGSPEQSALEQSFCEEFNRRNPDIYVRFVQVPGSAYLNKAVVMFASRTAPDLVRIDHYNFPELFQKGWFYDLSEIAAKDKGFHYQDFFPLAMDEARVDNGFYGLNQQFGAEIVYYNKTMVRQAGLADPYQLYLKKQWTWARFRQHAIAMTRLRPNGRAVQFGCAVPTFPMNVPVIWAFGGHLISPDQKTSRVGEPGVAAAYQFMADLRFKDHCAPTPAESANSAYSFESGQLGMTLNWMGMTPRYRSVITDFDWDICPLPAGPASDLTMVKGNQLVVNRESEHPEAAWRLSRFLTSPEIETELYINRRRNFPTRKSVAYSKQFLETTLPPYNTKAFLQAVEHARSLPIGPRWTAWTHAMEDAEDDLFSGRERNAAPVMAAAAQKINVILNDEEGF
jgi:multiple sugar transport system substrate-binding protein